MNEETSQSQSAQSARLSTRMQREIKNLHSDPPPGVCAWPANQNLLNRLEAQIEGPEETVYAKGVFKLQIEVPERYPFEPPNVRFVTPIYHPNIDSGGRICLDILNLPPKGAWRPSLNIATVLASIGLLLSEPNPDDGLMCDISAEYKHNRSTFDQKARSWTQKYAVQMECQTTTLPTNISNPGSSSLSGQGSNERNDNHKQLEESAAASVSGSPNQTNIKGKPKDGGPGSPVKSKKSLSKRLSLAKEPTLQPTINPASKGTVTDVNAKMFKENASCRHTQCDDKSHQQKLPTHPSVERNDNKDELLHKVAIGDSSSLLENVSTEAGKTVQKGVIMGKENFHSRNWNAEKPHCTSSVMKPLECETEIKMRENTKLRPLQNGLSGNSNQKILPFVSDDDPQCSKLHELQPIRPIIHKLPVSGLLQPESLHKKITEERSQVDTVIISDSESDEEPIQVRSRLSLSQRTLTGKRKFRSNVR